MGINDQLCRWEDTGKCRRHPHIPIYTFPNPSTPFLSTPPIYTLLHNPYTPSSHSLVPMLVVEAHGQADQTTIEVHHPHQVPAILLIDEDGIPECRAVPR